MASSGLYDMALVHSFSGFSEKVYHCGNAMKPSEMANDQGSCAHSNHTCSFCETQSVLGKAYHFSDNPSIYKSKSSKYSFIASDYTSSEGQKLLSIKVCEKPLENDSVLSKEKDVLTKRSISEYFLSKNNTEKENPHVEKGFIKYLQQMLFKSRNSTPHPAEEERLCNATNVFKRSSTKNSTIANSCAMSNIMESPENIDTSLQSQPQIKNLVDDPGTSLPGEFTETKSHNFPDKSLCKSQNLNPNINCRVFDIESLSEVEEAYDSSFQQHNLNFGIDDAWFIPSAQHTISAGCISGSTSAAQLSIASSFGGNSMPMCKICHAAAKLDDPLISPCRCSGTLRYIHCGCLMKWLEICRKRSRKPPTCELCKYQFHWHKKFKVGNWKMPNCSLKDKILHTVFVLSILTMIVCAGITIMCFKQYKGGKSDGVRLEKLTEAEIITLVCGGLFFLSFFLAMYVEIKARSTIYKLVAKFIYINQQWYIDEYDKKKENPSSPGSDDVL